MYIAAVATLALQGPASAATLSCTDAHALVEQADTRFASLRGDTDSAFGGVDSTLVLPGAEYCVIAEGAPQAAYRCRWRFAYRDAQAAALYEEVASELIACLGNAVAVADDRAVNHPDTSDAYLFTLPRTEARITLKDKRELDSTFVFFFIDGADSATPAER